MKKQSFGDLLVSDYRVIYRQSVGPYANSGLRGEFKHSVEI